MTTNREIEVCSLKNPEDFGLISIDIKMMLGCNFHYVYWEDKDIKANWFPAPSLKRAKAICREHWGLGMKWEKK